MLLLIIDAELEVVFIEVTHEDGIEIVVGFLIVSVEVLLFYGLYLLVSILLITRCYGPL